jgi:hypothetical protein
VPSRASCNTRESMASASWSSSLKARYANTQLNTCESASTTNKKLPRLLTLDEMSNEYSSRRWMRGIPATRSSRIHLENG